MPATSVERSGLSKHETRTTLRSFSWNLALRSVFDALCSGTGMFVTAFALALGIERESMGTVGAVASAACMLQLLALALNNRVRRKKLFTLQLAFAEPLVIAGAVLVLPFTPESGRLPMLLLAVFTAAAFVYMTKPATDAWLASAVPAGIRGRYLGRRFELLSIFAITTGLIMVLIGQSLREQAPLWSLAGLLIIGCMFGLLAVFPLRIASMPLITAAAIGWRDVANVARDQHFLRLIAMSLGFNLPFFLVAPFHYVYYLDVVGMTLAQAALVPVVYQLVKMPMLGLCGRFCDRLDSRHVLCAIGPIYILFFSMLAMAGPGLWWPVYLAWAMVAISDGAFAVIFTSVSYEMAHGRPARQAYFALLNLFSLGAYAIGGIAGKLLLDAFVGAPFELAGRQFGQFQKLWLLAATLMVGAMFAGYLLPRRNRKRSPAPTAAAR